MDYELYLIIKEVVKAAFGERADYCKFFLRFVKKESDTHWGRYTPASKTIDIYNLSRNTKSIIISVLLEVTRHIDYCNRPEPKKDRTFYLIFKQLLVTALSFQLISMDDIKDFDRQAKEIKGICKCAGNIYDAEYELLPFPGDPVFIKVRCSASYNPAIKALGFRFSFADEVFYIKVAKESADLIANSLFDLGLTEKNMQIATIPGFAINFVYVLCIANSYAHKDKLKAWGYQWNGYRAETNTWNKKIYAKQYYTELKNLNKLAGIKIKIYTPKDTFKRH